jgi:hypothetical protein
MAASHLRRLRQRAAKLPSRYRREEEARLDLLEVKVAARQQTEEVKVAARQQTEEVKQHVTAERILLAEQLQSLLERSAGRIPPMQPDQSLPERLLEIDQVLPGLRQERKQVSKQIAQEQREEKAAKRARRES